MLPGGTSPRQRALLAPDPHPSSQPSRRYEHRRSQRVPVPAANTNLEPLVHVNIGSKRLQISAPPAAFASEMLYLRAVSQLKLRLKFRLSSFQAVHRGAGCPRSAATARLLKATHLAGTESSLPAHRSPALSRRAARKAKRTHSSADPTRGAG